MEYVYETHLHTVEASACGKSPGMEYPAFMKERGYSGFIVTDHFFNGNSCVPRDLPWEERIALYCKGYEAAKEIQEAHPESSASVFFGVEFNFEGDEFLLYGPDKAWLTAHPEIMSMSRSGLYRLMKQEGFLMIQAHPYRERGYLTAIHLTPGACDGAEIYNTGNPPWQNALGYDYAKKFGLRPTSGSDIHGLVQPAKGGMSFPHPIHDIGEYVSSFLAGEGTPVYRVADGVFVPVEEVAEEITVTQYPALPVVWHEE